MTDLIVAAALGGLAGLAAGEGSRGLAAGGHPRSFPDRLSWLLGGGGALMLVGRMAGRDGPAVLAEAGLVGLLLLVLASDLRERAVYPGVVYPGVVFLAWAAPLFGLSVFDALFGAAGGAGLFTVLYAVGRVRYGPGALGAGDVSVAALLGTVVGLSRLAPALLLTGLIGAGFAVAVLVRTRSRRATLPYAPAMCLAAFCASFLPTT
jgi:leader peptidase (prepilin peptidase)/N-methyltransferase